jgi:hypothetical protein
MSEITAIRLDLAKSVFQVHGINEAGGEVTRKRLQRAISGSRGRVRAMKLRPSGAGSPRIGDFRADSVRRRAPLNHCDMRTASAPALFDNATRIEVDVARASGIDCQA